VFTEHIVPTHSFAFHTFVVRSQFIRGVHLVRSGVHIFNLGCVSVVIENAEHNVTVKIVVVGNIKDKLALELPVVLVDNHLRTGIRNELGMFAIIQFNQASNDGISS